MPKSRKSNRQSDERIGIVANPAVRQSDATMTVVAAGKKGRSRRIADNIKLRTKMIILSITCVLIPVIATNYIFWSMVYNAEQERVNYQMKDVRSVTEYQLDSLEQSIATMTATLYTNTGVYSFLDDIYADNLEFYNAYLEYIKPISLVYGNNTYISNYVIYADNDSLVNGGHVGKISDVRDTEWYQEYKESGKTSVVCSYYDRSRKTRTISVIRKLDFVKSGNKKRERFLKLDLSYGYYSRILSQQLATDIFICSEDRILFSNTDPSNGARPFSGRSSIDPDRAIQSFDYNMFGSQWNIYMYQSEESSELTVNSLVRSRWTLLASMILINILIPFAAIYIVSRSLSYRIDVLARHLNMVKDERFETINLPQTRDELGGLIRDYNHMTNRMRELIEDVYKERLQRQENELQKQRAELRALHSQINPHFMFNALESIRMRSLIKKEYETADIIELLARMMRKSTDWGDDMVTIENEASFAETYLQLQKYRFGDRLSYRIDIDPACGKLLVPKLSIVTFVENACVHGVESVRHDCIIILSAEMDEKYLRIYIEDTGAGMSDARCRAVLQEMRSASFDDLDSTKSVGTINACLRLKKCFGDGVEFELDSEEGAGLCITVSIPVDRIISEEGK